MRAFAPLLALLAACNNDACPDDRPFDRGGTWLGGECWRSSPYGYYYGYPYDYGVDVDAPAELPQLLVMDQTCSDDGWIFRFEVSSMPAEGRLVLDDGAGYQEVHEAVGADFTLGAALGLVDDPADVVPNQTTRFACDDEPTMVFQLVLLTPGGDFSECVVWSGAEADPADVYGPDLGGCLDANAW